MLIRGIAITDEQIKEKEISNLSEYGEFAVRWQLGLYIIRAVQASLFTTQHHGHRQPFKRARSLAFIFFALYKTAPNAMARCTIRLCNTRLHYCWLPCGESLSLVSFMTAAISIAMDGQ